MHISRSLRLISIILTSVCALIVITWSFYGLEYYAGAGFNTSASASPSTPQRHAYALLLTSSENENYFTSTRVMLYQLLHSDFASSLPVLVLVTADVKHEDMLRLEQDGARVVLVDKIEAADWMDAVEARWRDLLTKLRIFEQVEYDKICYLDTDILIVDNMDGVFQDPATSIKNTRKRKEQVNATLPDQYVFAARTDSWDYKHSNQKENVFNAGFLLFQPSRAIFEYYMKLVETQDLFGWEMMEQSMLNYAHRKDGNMPWQQMQAQWITDHPSERDYNRGLKAFHDKFWDWQPLQSKFLHDMYMARVKEMEDYWKSRSWGAFDIPSLPEERSYIEVWDDDLTGNTLMGNATGEKRDSAHLEMYVRTPGRVDIESMIVR